MRALIDSHKRLQQDWRAALRWLDWLETRLRHADLAAQ